MIVGDLDYHVGYGVNEHGVRVSMHVCRSCGGHFTVTPAVGHTFGGCQSEECDTYDPSRDASVYFLPDDPDLIEGGTPPGDGVLFRRTTAPPPTTEEAREGDEPT